LANKDTIRFVVSLASSILPWGLRRHVLSLLFGWDLAPDSRIGVVGISARQVELGPRSRIGHLTVCRRLDRLVLGADALIGKGNWITGHPRGGPSFGDDRAPELILERDAAISGQHLIDCTDRVHLGAFATLGGWRSQVLTHALDVRSNRQACQPVQIGEYCFIGTKVILLPGARVPARSVVAAGSVVNSALEEECVTYAGVPAKRVNSLSGDELYFSRSTGRVL
jgi:acetyltransferase-like isoleucine patch superfamily enzyme